MGKEQNSPEKQLMRKMILHTVFWILGSSLLLLGILARVLFRLLRLFDVTSGAYLLDLPTWLQNLPYVVCFIGFVCIGTACSMTAKQRKSTWKLRQKLEQEQIRKPIETPTLTDYLQQNSAQARHILNTEHVQKKQMSKMEREESEQLELLNQESSTEWW